MKTMGNPGWVIPVTLLNLLARRPLSWLKSGRASPQVRGLCAHYWLLEVFYSCTAGLNLCYFWHTAATSWWDTRWCAARSVQVGCASVRGRRSPVDRLAVDVCVVWIRHWFSPSGVTWRGCDLLSEVASALQGISAQGLLSTTGFAFGAARCHLAAADSSTATWLNARFSSTFESKCVISHSFLFLFPRFFYQSLFRHWKLPTFSIPKYSFQLDNENQMNRCFLL